MRDDRSEIEERIVVASILPVQKSNFRRIDDVRDNKIIVTAAQIVRPRTCLDLAQAGAHSLGFGFIDIPGVLAGSTERVKRATSEWQCMQFPERRGKVVQVRVVVQAIA